MRVDVLCTWVCAFAGSIVIIGAAIGVAGSLASWGWRWRKGSTSKEKRNRLVRDPQRLSVSPAAAEAFRTIPVYQSPLGDTESENIS